MDKSLPSDKGRARVKVPEPNLRTPDEDLNKVEQYKLGSHGMRGRLHDHFHDLSMDEIIDESEQLAKTHGIYLEYSRAKTGREKDWMYMIRLSIPGGGPMTRDTWRVLDELSEKYTANPDGNPSMRITTRQNMQFHWVNKRHVVEIVASVAETGFYSLNGCGDNTRNVMGCPLSAFSNVYDANALTRRFGRYFRLPAEPHIEVFAIDPQFMRTPDEHFAYGDKLLNRKLKIGLSAVHYDAKKGQWIPDNCVELRTNDIGIAPILEHGMVEAFQVYIGGGQGEKNGKPTFAALGKPFGVFREKDLLPGLDAIVKVHQEWGDRQNRHWARMKYVINKMGIDWYRQQVKGLGVDFELPIRSFDHGDRQLHQGWTRQPSNGLWAFGAYIENGRVIDGPNGHLKQMVRHLMEAYPIRVMTTPNQDLLFTDISEDAREPFEADMQRFGHGKRYGKPYSRLRVLSGACVGLYTCRLAYAESEQFEPELIDELEKRGYGDMHESIGITGCERQCFRPATKTIGWIGQGPDRYMLKLGGTEDARHQGVPLMEDDKMYLRQVPRKEVATVTAALFDFYKAYRRSEEESMGSFHRRVGAKTIIEYLKNNPTTAPQMERTWDAPYLPPCDDSENHLAPQTTTAAE